MKIKSFFAAFFAVILLASCASDDDAYEVFPNAEIPTAIKDYVDLYFPNTPIVSVRKENERGVISYDVALTDFIELEFNEDLEIVEIDGRNRLPDSVIPEPILSYVAENYPTNFITDWQLETGYQEVGLDNDIDLIFDLAGTFIRVD